jgi:hypothetical protein
VDIDIPGLSSILGEAAAAMLKAAPVIGGIILFLIAGIVALAVAFHRLLKAKDKRIEEKDIEIAKAKDAHIAMMEKVIPALHDLRETVIDIASSKGRRS